MYSRALLSTLSSLLLLVFASCTNVAAQQFVGTTYAQSQPVVNGAEITFWNILDTKGAKTSLLNYQNLGTNGKRQATTTVRKVVIMIHGLDQAPGLYMSNMLNALAETHANNPAVNSDTISIVAPSFSNGDQKNEAYPWTAGLAPGAGSTSLALVWQGSQWASGANNQYPYKQTTVSSFAVLDQMLQYYDNPVLFPNLKSIVVAGHSLGGQAVARYAAIGKNLGLRIPVRYWQANPNTYPYYGVDRPVYRDPASVCSTYGVWRDGTLSGLPPYNAEMTSQGSAAILANYRSKSKIYAKGTLDNGDSSSSCAPYTTGATRDERFFAQIANFPPTSLDNVDYTVTGHDPLYMMAAPAGQARLFLDNFSGDGSRAADFGDRLQLDDSPNPSSSNAPPPAIVGTGAGGATYFGCVVDADRTGSHSLSNVVSVSGSLTVESCTSACSSAGFSISGLLAGNQCLCGNALAYDALKVVERACSLPCPGNSAQLCGGPSRLSIWSGGTPTQEGAYGNVDTIPGYAYSGCYVDNANGVKALKGPTTSSVSNMTIERCAAFCKGYQYFGTEYAYECYCSQTLTGALAAQGQCTMLCSGSRTQLCGAGNRLSVYNSTTLISGSTTTSTSTSSTATTTTSTTTTSTGASTSSSAPLPSDPAYKGCYTDGTIRTLPAQAFANSSNTPALCRRACSALGFPIAGTEYGTECWCASQLAASGALVADSDCNMPCAGDGTSICGAGNRLSVYSDLATLPVAAAPQIVQSSGSYTFAGCYSDSANPRTLPNGAAGGSVERCAASCGGSRFFGLEYGGECWCGSALDASSTIQATTGCNMPCSGNAQQMCGGPNRLAVYSLPDSSSSSSTSSSSSSTSSSTSAPTSEASESSTSTTTSTSTTSTSSSAPSASNTSYKGCWTDGSQRTLGTRAYADGTNTLGRCRAACTSLGFSIAGTEYGTECWCGSQLASSSRQVADSQCSMPCSGDNAQSCGAGNRLSIYSDLETLPVAPVAQIVQSSGSYTFSACYSDSGNSRTLSRSVTGGSIERCATNCAGSRFFGVEYGAECYCGPSLASSATVQATTECNMVCSGNAAQLCGGPNRLAVYELTAGDGGSSSSSSSNSSSSTSSPTDASSSSAAPTTTSTSSSSSSSSTSSSSSAAPVSTLSSSYSALGCYVDSGARTLNGANFNRNTNTPVECAAFCSQRGYRYSGTEYASECYCSNFILNSGASGSGQSGCSMPCSGDSAQTCGGPNRLNIVEDKQYVPRMYTVQSTGQWRFSDCVRDTVSPRTLNVTLSGGSANTVARCLANCQEKNLPYCGMEYGGECYGAFELPSTITPAPSAGSSDPIARGCNVACSGNGTIACGGSALLNLYTFDSSRESTGTVLLPIN